MLVGKTEFADSGVGRMIVCKGWSNEEDERIRGLISNVWGICVADPAYTSQRRRRRDEG